MSERMTFDELLDESNRLRKKVDELVLTADWRGYLAASTRLAEVQRELDWRCKNAAATATSCG